MPLRWSTRINRPNTVWPHHLVVLMRNDVTMPDKCAWCVELCPDAGDLARIGGDRVLEADLPGLRRPHIAAELDGVHRLTCPRIEYQRLPVHHFKRHLVDMHGVGIGCEVVELPHL